jgi:hypothetical protein
LQGELAWIKSFSTLSENYPPRLVCIVLSLLLLFADLGATSEGQDELPQSFESGTWYLPENGMIIWLRQRNLLDKVICQFSMSLLTRLDHFSAPVTLRKIVNAAKWV